MLQGSVVAKYLHLKEEVHRTREATVHILYKETKPDGSCFMSLLSLSVYRAAHGAWTNMDNMQP